MMSDLTALQARLNQLQGALAAAIARRSGAAGSMRYIDLNRQASSLRFIVDGTLPRSPQEVQIARQELALIDAELRAIDSQISAIDAEIVGIRANIREVQTQISQASVGSPPVSAGAVVQEEQTARAQGANDQIPESASETLQQGTVEPQPTITVPSNAQSSAPGVVTTTAAPQTLPESNQVGPARSLQTSGNGAISGGDLVTAAQTVPVSVDALQNGPTLQPTQSYVYKATIVTSIFEKGRFTQELEGALLIFPFDTAVSSTADTRDTGTSATAAAQNTVATGNMRLAPPAITTGLPGSGVPASTPVGGGTSTLGPAQVSPATSDGQTVGVFDWVTVGQGTATSPDGNSPSESVGFDWATTGTTGTRSNQQLNRET